MPRISIVAPVYGVEKYIDQFLDSVRMQTFQDFEVILVDDGSKDNCPQILDEFAAEDDRFHVIHQENGGVSKARNTGLRHVTGEYIYIVDSDDWLEPTALENLWKEAERTNADIIYGDWMAESSWGSERERCFPRAFETTDKFTIHTMQYAVCSNSHTLKINCPEFNLIQQFGGAPWRALIKASIIRDNQLTFDPYVRGLGDDVLFSLHVYEYVKKVVYMQEVIYHYRKLDTSYSHGFKADYLSTVARIYEKLETFLEQYHKDEFAYKAYYMRVLIYLQQGMQRYFKNPDNPKSEAERYNEFKKVIQAQPYSDAIKKAEASYFVSRRMKYSTLLLRCGLTKLYWNCFR